MRTIKDGKKATSQTISHYRLVVQEADYLVSPQKQHLVKLVYKLQSFRPKYQSFARLTNSIENKMSFK